MDNFLKKLHNLLKFLLLFFVSLYDRFSSWLRGRRLKKLTNEKYTLGYVDYKIPKSEAVFREYLREVEEFTTDDIADFYRFGVGKELVERTNKDALAKKGKKYFFREEGVHTGQEKYRDK